MTTPNFTISSLENFRNGISGNLVDWIVFNRDLAFYSPQALALVAPFPPTELMQNVSGLTVPKDFAAHGCDILEALTIASPTPINELTNILDFGVGVGRLARMFKGFRGKYTGIDVDARHVEWVSSALDYVTGIVTKPKQALPLTDKYFDCIISISVFTHMNEHDQFFYLKELARVAQAGSSLFLTVHGERALQRAETESQIFQMLSVKRSEITETRHHFLSEGFNFILQQGHLTSSNYDYGITFISENYIEREWSKYFDVVQIFSGAIHDFQDIVLLKAR
jgi:SAM-dependent methyltransferase